MENHKTIIKSLAIALLAGAGLAGCVAVPAYGPPPGYGPPVVVEPWFGYYGGGRGHYGGRGRW